MTFSVGDTVTILPWEKLEALFVKDDDGDLELNALLVFPESKSDQCCKEITIEVILDNGEMYGDGLWFTPACIEDSTCFYKCRHCRKESEQ